MFDTCLALLDPVIRKEPCLVSKAHEEHLTRLFYMVWLRSNKVGVECYPMPNVVPEVGMHDDSTHRATSVEGCASGLQDDASLLAV